MTIRDERLKQLVAACIKKSKNPNVTGFADLIIRLAATFGANRRTAKEYVDILINSWHDNRWRSYVTDNLYLTPEERKEWLKP